MRRLVCGLFVVVLASAIQVTAAGSFDGRWTARVVRPAPADAADQGGKVTGSVAIKGGMESKIDWGFVKGDLITFKVRMPFNDQVVPFVYVGMVQADSIAFGRRPEDLTLGRLVEFSAARAK